MAELFKVNAPVRKPLFEGVQGENEARSIQFDITPWVEELGDGAVTATSKRSKNKARGGLRLSLFHWRIKP